MGSERGSFRPNHLLLAFPVDGGLGDDRDTHAGIDYAPWWLNQINWLDQINGSRTLDVFDIHAYFADNISTTGFTNPQLRTEVAKYVRTYWDPTYYTAGYDADWITTTQPNRGVTFLIPRMKAMVNAIYPGTPLSFTEWESFFNEWEFATALSDADAFGVMGREGLSFSTRWGGPIATDTHHQSTASQLPLLPAVDQLRRSQTWLRHALSLGPEHANPDLFVSYAALNSTGTTMTIMVLNKDPSNTANVSFNLTGFNASSYTAYTVGSTNPGAIIASAPAVLEHDADLRAVQHHAAGRQWNPKPGAGSEWYLNPDDLMVPASGTGTPETGDHQRHGPRDADTPPSSMPSRVPGLRGP